MELRQEEKEPKNEKKAPEYRGLYRYVNVSESTLNAVIIVGILAIILVVLFGVAHNGYTVTYDANGGTDVASVTCMYGDTLVEPAHPTREGYTFAGWYMDEACTYRWDFDQDTVTGSMTLYACWLTD